MDGMWHADMAFDNQLEISRVLLGAGPWETCKGIRRHTLMGFTEAMRNRMVESTSV